MFIGIFASTFAAGTSAEYRECSPSARRSGRTAPPQKVFKAAKDAVPPNIGGVSTAFDATAGNHPAPKVFKAAKDAADRGNHHLNFKSEDIEDTNDARGDHGCGLSGAQASAGKAIIKAFSEGDAERKKKFRSSVAIVFSVFLSCPCPLVPTRPARTVTKSHAKLPERVSP